MAKWSSGNYEKKYQKVKTWKTKNKSTKRELKIKLRRIKFEILKRDPIIFQLDES